jgi:cytoskeletal protein CcmA (bactofilin family)
MARTDSRIGQATVIRGTIRGAGDIDLHGRVEGSIDVDGDVTIADSARLRAPVNGARVVVRGAIAGNVRGKDSVVLEEGARVVGDLAAPSIGIRRGGLLRGHVASGEHAERAPTSVAARATRPATTQRTAPAAAPATQKKAEAKVEAKTETANKLLEPTPSPLTKPARTAPAPVMPALQKGAKAALKKKAR